VADEHEAAHGIRCHGSTLRHHSGPDTTVTDSCHGAFQRARPTTHAPPAAPLWAAGGGRWVVSFAGSP